MKTTTTNRNKIDRRVNKNIDQDTIHTHAGFSTLWFVFRKKLLLFGVRAISNCSSNSFCRRTIKQLRCANSFNCLCPGIGGVVCINMQYTSICRAIINCLSTCQSVFWGRKMRFHKMFLQGSKHWFTERDDQDPGLSVPAQGEFGREEGGKVSFKSQWHYSLCFCKYINTL